MHICANLFLQTNELTKLKLVAKDAYILFSKYIRLFEFRKPYSNAKMNERRNSTVSWKIKRTDEVTLDTRSRF